MIRTAATTEGETRPLQTKILSDEKDIPTHWYNVIADMPNPPAAEALLASFPEALVEQEVTGQRWIEIPEPVREIYQLRRPSPLCRAHRLEAALERLPKVG